MFKETNHIDKLTRWLRRLIPRSVFEFFQPAYHWSLSWLGAFLYAFPARSMTIIAVTGTKGKSSVVSMITTMLEDLGQPVAMVGSLGFKIKARTWPNMLKMTMPGRFKLQKFLYEAKQAGVRYVVLEVTSEGIAQHRLVGIKPDCAVMTNLRPEHIEGHGSMTAYLAAKQQLFALTSHIHILNADDPYFNDFNQFSAQQTLSYATHQELVNLNDYPLELKLTGDFNKLNALAALSVAIAYGLDVGKARASLEAMTLIPGRMELLQSAQGTRVFVDYAHTPDSLEAVYRNLKPLAQASQGKLICVLGSAGGGRDTWKRPVFGKLAEQYCDQIIFTNEDPYDEDPEAIIKDITAPLTQDNYEIIMDRKQAIKQAISNAGPADIIALTGKGSEVSMALANGRKIPWSDKKIVEEALD